VSAAFVARGEHLCVFVREFLCVCHTVRACLRTCVYASACTINRVSGRRAPSGQVSMLTALQMPSDMTLVFSF
jgi:hypothetical protein